MELIRGRAIMLNETLKELDCFIKLGTKDRLETLQETGKMYMKNLKYFVNLELETGRKGKGDALEASQLTINKHKMFINGEEVEIGPPPGIIRDEKHLNYPVFCLMYKKLKNKLLVEAYPDFCFEINLDDKLFEDFKDEEQPHALIISNNNEFIKRIDEALEKLKVPARRDLIEYRDKSLPKIIDGQMYTDDAFVKDLSFKHQEEYRILIEAPVEDHMILGIGDISDISFICSSDNIKNGLKIIPEEN